MELVVYLKDEKDLAILELLLKRLKLPFEKGQSQTPVSNPRKKGEIENNLLELQRLAAQIKESSFGNPVEWQREIRQDRII